MLFILDMPEDMQMNSTRFLFCGPNGHFQRRPTIDPWKIHSVLWERDNQYLSLSSSWIFPWVPRCTKMYQDVPRFLDLLRLLHHLTSMKSANHNERIATLHIGTNWDPQTGPRQLPGNCCANFLAKVRAKRGSEGPPKDTGTMTR